jgi:hypothetical protein
MIRSWRSSRHTGKHLPADCGGRTIDAELRFVEDLGREDVIECNQIVLRPVDDLLLVEQIAEWSAGE